MTKREPWAALLDRAIPAVPDGLRAAPLIAIREQARRRRADVAITAGLVVAILACSAFALTSWLRPTPVTLDPTRSAPPSAIPWSMVKVQADQRALSVGVFNPEEPPHCAGFAPVLSIVEEPSRVVITVTRFSTAGRCDEANPTVSVLPAMLRSPLGARVIVDGYDGRSPPVVQARWFPIPTHLLRLEVGADQPATAAGDRLGWAVGYGGVGGPGLGFLRQLRATHDLRRRTDSGQRPRCVAHRDSGDRAWARIPSGVASRRGVDRDGCGVGAGGDRQPG